MPASDYYDTTSFRYRAFICYSQHDRLAAEALHRRLESYRVPKRLVGRQTPVGPVPGRLGPIFRDCDELAASADIGEQLRSALAASQFLIVLCSPAAAQSRWVQAEIEIFWQQRRDCEAHILAAIVGGEPNCGTSEAECFPECIRFHKSGDVLPGGFPLAADLRRGSPTREDAEPRLVAALIGVGFDELKRRDQAGRVARLRRVALVSSGLAAAFVVIAAFAFSQRHAARNAADRATAARDESEKLLDFLLFDLRPKLESIGKLSLLESANAKVRAYYESVAPGEENPRTLRRRGTALANRGQDLVAQGDLAAAAEFLRAAKAIGERLVSLQPDGMKGQKNLAAIHGDLGDIAARQNDLARALEEQQSASEILEAAAASGHRTELAYDIATSAYKLGKLDMQQGRTAAATAAFQRAILGYEEMLHVSPQFPCKIEMMAALNGLGEAERNSGKATKAETLLRRALTVGHEVLAIDGVNAKALDQMQFSHAKLGGLLGNLGHPGDAMTELEACLTINRKLVALEPANVQSQRSLARAYQLLGELLCQQERYAEAEPYVREALTISEELVALHPDDMTCLGDMSERFNHLADLYLGTKRPAEALEATERAINVRRKLLQANPTDQEKKHWLAYDLYCAGDASLALHRPVQAERYARESIDIAHELLTADPPNLVPLQFRALYELQLGHALRDQGKLKEAEVFYRQCQDTVEIYVARGGPSTSVMFPRQEAAKALMALDAEIGRSAQSHPDGDDTFARGLPLRPP